MTEIKKTSFEFEALSQDAKQGLINRFFNRMKQEDENRSAFVQSSTFQSMVDAIANSPKKLVTHCEECSYFLDRVKKRMGWPSDITEADVRLFWKELGNEHSPAVDPKSIKESVIENGFQTISYTYGNPIKLYVDVLIGQGSIIAISNRPFK